MVRGGRTASGEWINWAGDQSCRPDRIAQPRSRDELAEVVATAAAAGKKVRVAGSGHSFTE
ncbi:MAG TPA: FAD-binding protein, partial [Solirubrobacterales bacterium]